MIGRSAPVRPLQRSRQDPRVGGSSAGRVRIARSGSGRFRSL